MKTFKSAIIGLGNIGFESDAKISKNKVIKTKIRLYKKNFQNDLNEFDLMKI